MGFLARRLNVELLSPEGQSLVFKFFWLTFLAAVVNIVSSTFIYLHVIDLEGFAALGTIMAISFLVSAVTDFPTGVLADWLGHRWVLAFAYVLYAGSYGLLFLATDFNGLVAAFVVLALANGQASGALQSWFDNQYKFACMKEDPRRETYRELMGKSTMYLQYGSSIFFVIGGVIAAPIASGRNVVFALQAVGSIAMAVLFAMTLRGPADEEGKKKKEDGPGYFTLLGRGIKFAFSSKLMILIVLSTVLISAVGMTWYTLVLFPVYFGYTGSDIGASGLRWLIWFIGAYLSGKAGTLSKRLAEKQWIPRADLIGMLIFFGATAAILTFIPLTDTLNYLGTGLIFLDFIAAGFFFSISRLLSQKMYLEIIPDDMRNSIYSLLPTLGMLAGAPLVYFLGGVMEEIGFVTAIYVFTIIGLTSALIKFMAMRYYVPPDEPKDVEFIIPYDIYSFSNFEPVAYPIGAAWEMGHDISDIWAELVEVALEDGQITREEADLLDIIMNNLEFYGEAVEIALQDNVLSDDEAKQLMVFRSELIQDVEREITKDGNVTPEELKLLNMLASQIEKMLPERKD